MGLDVVASNALGNIANFDSPHSGIKFFDVGNPERCVEQIMETVKNFRENETLQRQPLKKVDEIDVRFGSLCTSYEAFSSQ